MAPESSNLQELRKALLVDSPTFEAVSFDVFDTLVQRTLPHPDVTKIPAARKLHFLLKARSIDTEIEDLHRMRLEIELEFRNRAAASGHDPECRIDEVFFEWVERVGLDPVDEDINALISTELEGECSVVYPTPGMVDLIESLQQRNVSIFFVTDMYLRHWMVEKILDQCGYGNCFTRGYVSCEFLKAKYSGKLFQHVLEQQNIPANGLVHVGDRLDADVEGAAKAKVRAIRFTDHAMLERQTTQAYINSIRTSDLFWQGASWSQWSIASNDRLERSHNDIRYRLGYLYLGPLFTNFIHRVLNQVRETQVELVLLNSREGFLLQELYTRIAGAMPETDFPPARYAYLTRKSIYAASLKAFGDREINMGFHTITPSLRNMFVRYSLPASELEEIAMAAGFKSIDAELHDPWSSPELKTLISDPMFLSVMHSTRETAAAVVYDYLGQIGYWDCRTVAMVDVGWNGTTQEALSVAFSHLNESPEIAGFYMALTGHKQFRASEKSKFTGIYHDYRNNGLSTPFSRFLELFETACRAPHATVIGFKRDSNDKVLPVFKAPDSMGVQREQKDDAMIASIQCGILDYADDYVRTLAFHDRDPAIYSDYFLYKIDRLLRYPTREEAEVLASFSHSEDFGQSLVHIPKNTMAGREGHKQLNPARQRVLWREASMVSGPVPGLNTLFNFYRLIRTKRY